MQRHCLRPEVPLRHGDNSAPEESGASAASGGTSGEGIRLPDPQSGSEAPEDPGAADAAGSVQGGVADRRGGYRRSDPDRSEDDQVHDQVNIQAARVEVSQAWSGPLPPPEILAEYERLLPGAAERILMMAEKATTGQIDHAKS
jgi:hypothetical protein